MIGLLEFKEGLCLYLLHSHEKDGKSLDDLLVVSLETPRSHGILGFLIASVLMSTQASQKSNQMVAITHRWRGRQGGFHCTMLIFAENLLFKGEPSDENLERSYSLGNADLQVRCAMATAMIDRNHIALAYEFLNTCAKDLRSMDSVHLDEFFPIMTELVKCCNILNREEQGEAIALEALRHRYSDTAARHEICDMQIALADSYIGRSKYSEAGRLLEEVLDSEYLSNYLTTVASLRLNKVKRRLGILDVSAFTRNSALQNVLMYASGSSDHIKDECLDELSSTVSFTQQRIMENAPAVKAVLDTASIIVGSQTASTRNWRTRALQEQVAHVSRRETQEGQSIYAQRSQKVPPLRVMLLCNNPKLYTPILDLDDLNRFWNAQGRHGKLEHWRWLPKLILGRYCPSQNSMGWPWNRCTRFVSESNISTIGKSRLATKLSLPINKLTKLAPRLPHRYCFRAT